MAVTASAQEPTEWPATTRRRSSAPVSARTAGSAAARATQPLGQRLGVRGGKESSSGRPARNSFSAALLASTGTSQAAAS